MESARNNSGRDPYCKKIAYFWANAETERKYVLHVNGMFKWQINIDRHGPRPESKLSVPEWSTMT